MGLSSDYSALLCAPHPCTRRSGAASPGFSPLLHCSNLLPRFTIDAIGSICSWYGICQRNTFGDLSLHAFAHRVCSRSVLDLRSGSSLLPAAPSFFEHIVFLRSTERARSTLG